MTAMSSRRADKNERGGGGGARGAERGRGPGGGGRTNPMGAAAPDRDGRTGEGAMGTAAAAKRDWIDRRGSLSRRRAWLPKRNGRDRFPAYADQSAGDGSFCDGSSGLRIQISREAFGT